MPEPDEEEIPEPAEEETPEQYDDEIPEPDTDELLEQYGEEYGDDETLESYHKPKPTSPIHHNAKKPVMVPARQGQGSSETVDDALFLRDKEPVPVKSPVNKIRIIGGGIVLIAILAAVFLHRLPMLTGNGDLSTHSSPTAAEITPTPEPTIARTTPPTLTDPGFPCSRPPANTADTHRPEVLLSGPEKSNNVKDFGNFHRKCRGGSISRADIKVTHTDGSVTTGIILPLKGVTEITLDGSKESDRVEIIAKMSSGETYRVYDDLVPFVR